MDNKGYIVCTNPIFGDELRSVINRHYFDSKQIFGDIRRVLLHKFPYYRHVNLLYFKDLDQAKKFIDENYVMKDNSTELVCFEIITYPPITHHKEYSECDSYTVSREIRVDVVNRKLIRFIDPMYGYVKITNPMTNIFYSSLNEIDEYERNQYKKAILHPPLYIKDGFLNRASGFTIIENE